LEEPAIACDMTALDAAQRERQHILMERFRASLQETQSLQDGYAFRLPPDTATIMDTAEFIAIERLCCPFLNFALEIGPAGQPLWLRLTGRAGVKEFIEAEFGMSRIDRQAP
jgi:hypothetical protein